MSFVRLPVLRHGLLTRDTELLPDRIMEERLGKVRRLMAEKKVASLLVYADPTGNGPVCYLTNYPCFGLGRRATAVVGTTGGPFLFTAEPSRNLPRVRIMTTCDLEKTRQFLSAGCDRARKLAGNGHIGLVGIANLPHGLVQDLSGLSGMETVEMSDDFSRLMVSKDEGCLEATRRAFTLAGEGSRLLAEQAGSGMNLWEMAAEIDHRLRLAGCEDTNILLNCSTGGRLRPACPAPITPASGDTIIAYLAVQYARHWGAAGMTLKIGPADEGLARRISLFKDVQREAATEIKAGLTLGGAKNVFLETARRKGITLAGDLPLAAGVGFDLVEYPRSDADRLEKNMVLQVVLAEDSDDDGSALTIGMLQIGDGGSAWLTTDAAGSHPQETVENLLLRRNGPG